MFLAARLHRPKSYAIPLFSRAAFSCTLLALSLGTVLGTICSLSANAQNSDAKPHNAPLPLKPGIPGTQTNHRLILKDGTYQIVRKYEVVGDRVRYISIERGGEWEELPTEIGRASCRERV